MKILIAIPAFNCAPQIARLLDRFADLTEKSVHEIWIIDNGSTDETVAVAISKILNLKLTNIKVLQNPTNVNLGGTQKRVFNEAQKCGFSHVLIFHGDDQASAHDVLPIIDFSQMNSDCTVLGSRFMRNSTLVNYDKKRIIGNWTLNLLFSMRCRKWLTDLGSGLNLFRLQDFEGSNYLNFTNGMAFNYEVIIDFVKRKINFLYYPITWTEQDQVSNARNAQVFLKALRILLLPDRHTNNQKLPNQETIYKDFTCLLVIE